MDQASQRDRRTQPTIAWLKRRSALKIVIVVAFVLIIGSLASALVFMIRDRGRTRNTVRALAFRVGFSIALFALILTAHYLGWIQSTGVPIGMR
jgi:hypothetical protein